MHLWTIIYIIAIDEPVVWSSEAKLTKMLKSIKIQTC